MKSETADTIVAIATPPGRAALGIVRISGKDSLSLVGTFFQPNTGDSIPANRPLLGRIRGGGDQQIDEVLLTYFRGPHSYTCEDVVEISCHGSPLILERILARIVAAGARLAMPGEFTYRAFLHGRLDLVQAEAVQDLIQSDSLAQAQLALQQLNGRLSGELKSLRGQMLELVALMEGNIDLSEEQHYLFIHRQEAAERLRRIAHRIRSLLGTFERGRMVRDGFNVALIGRPNVGKSSVFNMLLGEDRAIVTATAGTTRDYLRERIRLGPALVNLLDTAGIRAGFEEAEVEGIRRSRQVIEKADLIVMIVDGTEPLAPADHELWAEMKARDVVLVCNKSDRREYEVRIPGQSRAVRLSALTGEGCDELLDEIRKRLDGRVSMDAEDTLVANLRHRTELDAALKCVGQAEAGLQSGATEEMTLVDLHEAMSAIGRITGEVTIDDLYQYIFSNFCIGK